MCLLAFIVVFPCLFIEIPVVTKDPQDSIHMEGDDVTLCCQATGSPAPVYEW